MKFDKKNLKKLMDHLITECQKAYAYNEENIL